MNARNIFFPIITIFTLFLLACSSGAGTAAVAVVTEPEPTAVPAPILAPTLVPTVAPTDVPTVVPESSIPSLPGLDNIDTAAMMQQVLRSPELMGCLTGSMSITELMGLAERSPTAEDMALILPCFSDEQLGSLSGLKDLIPAP